MEKLKVTDCESGMRVILPYSSCIEHHYDIDERNPAATTEYECAGTVVWCDSGGEEVEVEWDNGCVNVYIDEDLAPLITPGLEGCVNIW